MDVGVVSGMFRANYRRIENVLPLSGKNKG
jgi:hypothetical protein